MSTYNRYLIIDNILNKCLDKREDIIYDLYKLVLKYNEKEILIYLYKYIKQYYKKKKLAYNVSYGDNHILINHIGSHKIYLTKYNIFSVNPKKIKFVSFYLFNSYDYNNIFFNIFIHMCSKEHTYISFHYSKDFNYKFIDHLKYLLPPNIIIFDYNLIL